MLDADEIYRLIMLKQEGAYWDFKRQWYEKGYEDDMLHDIICMANNLENRDAYIIIGVNEENDFLPFDITNDSGRKNTQKIVDFLRDKKFSGDVRPVVTVEFLEIYDYKVDVIIIHNSNNTPFYLKERFRKVSANNIYARIQDTNTPIDKSADLIHIEYLWKKRFGLLISPLEKMKIILKNKNEWDNGLCGDDIQYYKYFPEYTIQKSWDESKNAYESYMLTQTDNTPHWCVIQLKYHQTVLKEMSGISLDGGRHFSPCPCLGGFSLGSSISWDVSYFYWIKDSLEYIVHEFYFDKESYSSRLSDNLLNENILLFENESEYLNFKNYLIKNWDKKELFFDEINIPYIKDINGYNMEFFRKQLKDVRIIKKILEKFREC